MNYRYCAIFFVLTLNGLRTSPAFAGELTLEPSVTSSVSVFNREFEDDTSRTERALSLIPSLSTVYNSKHASLSMLLKHSAIARDGNSDSSSTNYTDIQLASQFVLIENLLSFEVSADQSYRARSQSQFDFSDRISAPDDLAKIQSDKALLSFSLPNPPYIGLNWQASLSHKKTDSGIDDGAIGNRVDGSNVLLAANIFNGHKLQSFSYNFSAQYNDTSRANFANFKSTNLNGSAGMGLGNDFSVIAQGRLDDYNSDSLGLISSRRNLDTSSYGAGIRWQPRDSRLLELTYNQLKQNENTTGFVGASAQWAFSSRTSMTLDYGKRFYGDAYTFAFDYNLKSLRVSMSYNEDVTTFARLDTTSQDVGIFVCSFGSSDLEDCFQPDSLEYVLQPGEEFRSLTEISSDIAEDVIFRKNGNISIGYQKRKLKALLNITRRTTEYLESDRERTRTSASLNLDYALGRRSNVGLTTTISQQTSGNESIKTRTFASTLTFNRSIQQNLVANLSLRYAKLNRSDSSLNSVNTPQDLVSTSLNASLSYRF